MRIALVHRTDVVILLSILVFCLFIIQMFIIILLSPFKKCHELLVILFTRIISKARRNMK